MTALFSGSSTRSLTRMRYKVFSKKVVTASSFVSAQIMAWMEKEDGLDALKWGWKLEDNQYIPVMTRNAALDSLLKVVHCNCSNACATRRCTCGKYGLPCIPACGPCQIQKCNNPNNYYTVVKYYGTYLDQI